MKLGFVVKHPLTSALRRQICAMEKEVDTHRPGVLCCWMEWGGGGDLCRRGPAPCSPRPRGQSSLAEVTSVFRSSTGHVTPRLMPGSLGCPSGGTRGQKQGRSLPGGPQQGSSQTVRCRRL